MERNSSSPPSLEVETYLPDLIQLQARIGASSARILRPLDERLQEIRSSGATEQNQTRFADQLLEAVVLTYGLVAHATLAVLRVALGRSFAEHGPFLVVPSFTSTIIRKASGLKPDRSASHQGDRLEGPARVQMEYVSAPLWSFDHYQLRNPDAFLADENTINEDLDRILLADALTIPEPIRRAQAVRELVLESFLTPEENRERLALLNDRFFFPVLAKKSDLYSTTRLFVETSTQEQKKPLHYLLLGLGFAEDSGSQPWREEVFRGCRIGVRSPVGEIIREYPSEALTGEMPTGEANDHPGLEEYLHYVRLSLLPDPKSDFPDLCDNSEQAARWAARFERGAERSNARAREIIAEALNRKSNLRYQASLSCFEPFIRRSDGGLVIYSGSELPIGAYHSVYQVVVPALTQIGRIEELAIKYGEAISGAQAKEQADLLPKWAHGQRGSLFAIAAGLGASYRAMERAEEGLSPAHTKDVRNLVRNTLTFVAQSHGNIDLLQEIGSYYRNEQRWQDELRSIYGGTQPGVERLATRLVREAIVAGMRTALVRLLNVPNGEQDQRYINAFARFFQQGLLGIPFAANPADRLSATEIVNRVHTLLGIDLLDSLSEIQENTSSGGISKALSLMGFPDVTEFLREMDGLVIPIRASSADLARNPVFFPALRMAAEEVVLNYIKYARVTAKYQQGPSMIINWSLRYHPKMPRHRGIRSVSITFMNAANLSVLRNRRSQEQRSLGSGLLLCQYLLRGIGGQVQSFDSTMSINSLPFYCSTPPWDQWFGLELTFPAGVAS